MPVGLLIIDDNDDDALLIASHLRPPVPAHPGRGTSAA